MSTLIGNKNKIINCFNDIRDSILAKNVSPGSVQNYPDAIRSIGGGSSSTNLYLCGEITAYNTDMSKGTTYVNFVNGPFNLTTLGLDFFSKNTNTNICLVDCDILFLLGANGSNVSMNVGININGTNTFINFVGSTTSEAKYCKTENYVAHLKAGDSIKGIGQYMSYGTGSRIGFDLLLYVLLNE